MQSLLQATGLYQKIFCHDLRRIQNFLAKVSSFETSMTQIKLISDGTLNTVSIDGGGGNSGERRVNGVRT